MNNNKWKHIPNVKIKKEHSNSKSKLVQASSENLWHSVSQTFGMLKTEMLVISQQRKSHQATPHKQSEWQLPPVPFCTAFLHHRHVLGKQFREGGRGVSGMGLDWGERLLWGWQFSWSSLWDQATVCTVESASFPGMGWFWYTHKRTRTNAHTHTRAHTHTN